MLKNAFVLKTDDMHEVVRLIDSNFDVFADCVNANHQAINKLMKKTRFKASKVSVFLLAVAGITYIVKNESDKQDLNYQLLEMDKRISFSNEHNSDTNTELI